MSSTKSCLVALAALLLSACSAPSDDRQAAAAATVTVYSSRAEHLIKPLFDRFTAETGIAVRYTTDSEAALISRLRAEGDGSPADMLLTVDAGNLWYADSLGLFEPVESAVLEANIPPRMQAQSDTWFGLSARARTLVYSTLRVDPTQLQSYESLVDPRWRARLCLRTSNAVYNQSLVASMISRLGAEQTEEIVRGWVANLAIEPLNNDTRAIEAIVAGVCDVAIVNSYYFGRLEAENPDIPVAIFWPNQGGSGVHLNVSGAGILRTAPHPELALRLLEWLSQPEAQQLFAGLNKEFPVNPQVDPVPQVQNWGSFEADALHVEEMGRLQAQAIMLMDRAGYR